MLIDGAAAYMEEIDYEWEFRFDVIGIVKHGGKLYLDHFPDAFFPGW